MFQIHLDLARYHELGQFVEKSALVCSGKENVYSTKEYGDKKDIGVDCFMSIYCCSFSEYGRVGIVNFHS